MTLHSSLDITGLEITAGTVTCKVTGGSVTVTLEKKGVDGKWKSHSTKTYGTGQGQSNPFSTTVDTSTSWRISVKGQSSLSAMNLTVP